MDENAAQATAEPADAAVSPLSPEAAPAGENPQAPAAADGDPNPIHALIDIWWNAHFPNSPISRASECWNHALAAKEALKRILGSKS